MKILVSPGYGAGWSTWNDDTKFVLTYKPLIDAIEKEDDTETLKALEQFKQEYKERNSTSFYDGGFHSLEVVEVFGKFDVDEYDGFESVTIIDDMMDTKDFENG